MTEPLLRILIATLIGGLAAALFWKLQRDRATGVVRREDDNGSPMTTLDRAADPRAFRSHIVRQAVLIGLLVLMMLAVLFIPISAPQ